MPYLRVELDAMHSWPMMASGLGVPDAQVYKGMLKLWESRWRASSGYVTLLFLECLFEMPGRGERCAEVLTAFGFLQKREDGYWVSGAEDYLRIKEARSKGGKKASGNLKRGKSPGSSRKAAGSQPEDIPGSGPALTPNHPITHSPIETKSIAPAVAAPPAPKSELKALEADLVADYAVMRPGAKYKHGGARDTEALKAILALKMPRETVRGMWRYGLRAPGWLGVNSIAQFGAKFNDLAGFHEPLPRARDPAPIPRPRPAADPVGATEEIPF